MLSIAGGRLGKVTLGKSADSAVLDDSLCAARALQLNNASRPVNTNNGKTFLTRLGMNAPEQTFVSRLYVRGSEKFLFVLRRLGLILECQRIRVQQTGQVRGDISRCFFQ